MPFTKIIRATIAGTNTGPFVIYHTSVSPSNIIATTTRDILLSGLPVSIPDGATQVIVVSTGTCTNSVTIPVSAAPTPTPTPTSTPTPTVTPTATPPVLTLGYLKGPNLFTASLNVSVGGDIIIGSIFADGFTSGGGVAVASASKTSPTLALPAGNLNFSFSPTVRCGGIGSSCWNTATKYTIYNVIINGTNVFNGDVVTIAGTPVTISFPPLRDLLA